MAKPKDRRGGKRRSARIILADPESYAGLGLEWARLWMKRDGNSKEELRQTPSIRLRWTAGHSAPQSVWR